MFKEFLTKYRVILLFFLGCIFVAVAIITVRRALIIEAPCIPSVTYECIYLEASGTALLLDVFYLDEMSMSHSELSRSPWNKVVAFKRGANVYVHVALIGNAIRNDSGGECGVYIGNSTGKLLSTNRGMVSATCEARVP